MTSPLEFARLNDKPSLPICLHNLSSMRAVAGRSTEAVGNQKEIKNLLPRTYGQPVLRFQQGKKKIQTPLRLGVVFSGGPAPGGHNVIIGLFDALKALHSQSRLFGFLDGPLGVINHLYIELNEEILANYLNTGGFDLIGSGRTKIETAEQFVLSRKSVESLALDGLIIIGGDDSNTNAALLAEYFDREGCQTRVIGVPKTIDGDLKNDEIETSFGFDTACKTYAELIGNIARDALSTKKYYHFIKLMGRSASHIALECALQTHPNITLIGEEIAARRMTLRQITSFIANKIYERAKRNKHYGVILIPEGLITCIVDIQDLIEELNTLVKNEIKDPKARLSVEGRKMFEALPKEIAHQLLFDRDSHGNVQVSHVSTEHLLIGMVKDILKQRSDDCKKFLPIDHFLGYEGRSCPPSNFDADYSYTLGFAATLLVDGGYTGYLSTVHGLAGPSKEWEIGGVPMTMLMHLEKRQGEFKPVIRKTLVDLEGELFKSFVSYRDLWSLEDHYRYPGPIQFFGPEPLKNRRTLTLEKKI
ncbi:MAG: diphosphate--fructose-6-phosphate 1-phosphotransferase [Chlamydiales bacterium]